MITLEYEIDKGVFPMAPSKTGFKLTTLDLVYISLFSVLIAICAWIAIPSTVPFTLQTFGVMCTLGLLGGKRGTLAVLVYLLLGAVGIPVFSNFRGGIGMLVGSTGGYLLGFLFSALLYWLLTSLFGNRFFIRVVSMVLGLVVLYAFGTAWFVVVYSQTVKAIDFQTAISLCVLPFLIPEAIKTALAIFMVRVIPTRVKAFR